MTDLRQNSPQITANHRKSV